MSQFLSEFELSLLQLTDALFLHVDVQAMCTLGLLEPGRLLSIGVFNCSTSFIQPSQVALLLVLKLANTPLPPQQLLVELISPNKRCLRLILVLIPLGLQHPFKVGQFGLQLLQTRIFEFGGLLEFLKFVSELS